VAFHYGEGSYVVEIEAFIPYGKKRSNLLETGTGPVLIMTPKYQKRSFAMRLLLSIFILSLYLAGCEARTDATRSMPPLMTSRAPAGGVVHIVLDKTDLRDSRDRRVSIGNRPANILEIIDDRAMVVHVPMLEQGRQRVEVVVDNKTVFTGVLTIVPARFTRPVLSYEDNAIRLIRETNATAGEFILSVPDQRRLAYDLFTADGDLVFTGDIPHPLAQHNEVFFEDGGIRREAKLPQRVVFTLKLPVIPGKARLRFYDVPPQLDLSSLRGRKQRHYLGQLEIGGKYHE
jgi:hypothetical protein